jgi:hypothetical protein
MDSTPIYQYAKPTSATLKPPESLEPIITPGNELRPCLIKLIWDKSFSEKAIKTHTHTYKSLNRPVHVLMVINFYYKLSIKHEKEYKYNHHHRIETQLTEFREFWWIMVF